MNKTEEIILHEIIHRGTYCSQLCKYLDRKMNHNTPENYLIDTHAFILQKRIATIDSWIMLLPRNEAFVLREHLAYGRNLDTVLRRFELFFGEIINENQLLRIQEKGLQRIAKSIDLEFDSSDDLLLYMDYNA
mgnify:FL=1